MHRIDELKFSHPILLFLALLFLCLVAIHPFLTDSLPLSDDSSIHIYRSIVLDYSIRNDGVFYPRYSPALVYGYGAPLFNYFPPTAYYPTVLLHGIGLSWVAAWKSTMIFYVLMAAWGAYSLGLQWTNEIGGFITAVAYVYSPYVLFDTVTRGTSTEFAGMAFLPFALWAFTRLARYGRRTDFILATLAYALFILLHNLMTLYGSLLLVAYCAFLVIVQDVAGYAPTDMLNVTQYRKRAFWQMLLAGILAVLMTAFFWWPALAETDFVKINGVAENLDFIDVRNTLRSLADVFALPRTADPTQLQAPIPVTFAWPQMVLAAVGIGLSLFIKRARYVMPLQILLLIAISVITFSQLEISANLWQSISILRYSQFAWRTMSIGSLALAFLAGIGASLLLDTVHNQATRIALFCLCLVIIITYAIPWLYRPSTDLQAESVADAIQYEIDTGELALSSYSEYLPVLTDETALEPTLLLPYFQENSDVPRLQDNTAITVVDAKWAGTSATLSLEASDAATLIFDWLYFEGWQARVDGDSVEVYAFGDAAFVAINIDEGSHEIHLALKDTPTQQWAGWLSLGVVVLFIGAILFYPFGHIIAMPRQRRNDIVGEMDSGKTDAIHHVPTNQEDSVETASMSDERQIQSTNPTLKITIIILGITLFLTKIAIIDQTNNFLRAERFANGLDNGVEIALNTNYDDEIRLLGALSINAVKAGEMANVRLFWSLSDDEVLTDYSSLIELRDSQGIVIAETGSFYIGGLATTEWLSGYYLEEVINLQIPPDTPPDAYMIEVSIYDSITGQRLNVLNADGNPVDVTASVSTLTILKPDKPMSIESSPIASDENLSLLEINGIPEQAQVGDEMIVDWLFQMDVISEDSLQAKLLWLNTDNQAVAEMPFVDIVNNYPTTEWQAGDIWRGYHRFYVAGNLDAGQYTVAVQLSDTIASIAEMQVTVPKRDYEVPNFENASDARWQNGIELLGYEQTRDSISLYWQSDEVMNDNLRLFVQVLDEENRVLFVDDSIPVNWTRPTTGWDVAEVITTQHDFGELPEGDYDLLIGWYNPLTGNRILLNTGEDALRLEK